MGLPDDAILARDLPPDKEIHCRIRRYLPFPAPDRMRQAVKSPFPSGLICYIP